MAACDHGRVRPLQEHYVVLRNGLLCDEQEAPHSEVGGGAVAREVNTMKMSMAPFLIDSPDLTGKSTRLWRSRRYLHGLLRSRSERHEVPVIDVEFEGWKRPKAS